MIRLTDEQGAAAVLAALRARYPQGLFCTSPRPCSHRLIATIAAAWERRWAHLPPAEREARRAAFVCAECRLEAEEQNRLATTRRAHALRGLNSPQQKPHSTRSRVGDQGVDSGSEKTASASPEESGTSNTVLRRIAAGRAFRPGRPRLASVERLRRRRERDRIAPRVGIT
jgi:hypothetical protein